MRIDVAFDGFDGLSGEAPSRADGRLRGQTHGSLDGVGATHRMALMRDGRPVSVETGAPGVSVDVYQSLDRTRGVTSVSFEDAPAELLDAAQDPLTNVERAFDAGRVVLLCFSNPIAPSVICFTESTPVVRLLP